MPWPDRTTNEWKGEISDDMGLVIMYAKRALSEDAGDPPEVYWASAIKESRRLTSDLYRMAATAGITREQIDRVGPL